jgi:hypothetical protein
MTDYVPGYEGELKFESRGVGTLHMAKWKAWVGGFDEALINRGPPASACAMAVISESIGIPSHL